MIKAVIFDFDGVLVESVDIKTDAFRELLKDYPQHIEKLIQYHIDNGGVSRVEKIKYFYEKILKEELTENNLKSICARFSELVVDKVVSAKWVSGAKELLEYGLGRWDMFVVSGTPEEEMRLIIKRRKMAIYFKEVFGSPRKKEDIVKGLLDRFGYERNSVVFVGDAVTDFNAAKKNQILFIGRLTKESGDWINNKYVAERHIDLEGVKQWFAENGM